MWLLFKGYRVSVLQEEKVQEICLRSDVHILNTTELCEFENGEDGKFCVFC